VESGSAGECDEFTAVHYRSQGLEGHARASQARLKLAPSAAEFVATTTLPADDFDRLHCCVEGFREALLLIRANCYHDAAAE
jgi:hypothetical protein